MGHDIFVSYSHGDPHRHGLDRLKDWTRAVVRELQSTMSLIHPDRPPLKVFIDDLLDENAALTDTLQPIAENAKLLVLVMTPPYLLSGWCKDELEWFKSGRRGGKPFLSGQYDRRGQSNSILVMRAMPTDTKTWPDCLRDSRGHTDLGFKFHADDSNLPYGFPDLDPVPNEVYPVLDRMITVIIKELDKQERLVELEARLNAEQTLPDRPTLYLHPDAKEPETWSAVRDQLSSGFEITPERIDETEDQRARLHYMKKADGVLALRESRSHSSTAGIIGLFQDEKPIAEDNRDGRRLPGGIACPVDLFDPLIHRHGVAQLFRDSREWPKNVRDWLEDQTVSAVPA